MKTIKAEHRCNGLNCKDPWNCLLYDKKAKHSQFKHVNPYKSEYPMCDNHIRQ